MGYDIIAKAEALDKIVKGFAEKLGDYINNMQSEIDSLENALNRLGNEWNDSNYENFATNMKNRISFIRRQMKNAEEQKEFLEQKSEEYRIMLEFLREASDE